MVRKRALVILFSMMVSSVFHFGCHKNVSKLSLDNHALGALLISDPGRFMKVISQDRNWLSEAAADRYDRLDPLGYTASLFNIGAITPFAGHSLGPVFKPVNKRIAAINQLQKNGLHQGHFPGIDPAGNWFDCDIEPSSLEAVKSIIGFKEDDEFVFSANGLSANLAMLMDNFYRPTKNEWQSGKTLIAFLGNEFFSDQSIVYSLLNREIDRAQASGFFSNAPTADSQTLKLEPDTLGLYDTDSIINTIREKAHNIKILQLSDIVFSTGQRLDIPKILSELRDTIETNEIVVGLDLAHTIGNRKIDLSSLPVTYAVGCGYKHISGFAGSGFGFYVSNKADLDKYKPIQGWKAANSHEVFSKINSYEPQLMQTKAARAFRTSNTSPVAIAPAQVYINEMHKIGFDSLFAKSECLTQYMLAQLHSKLGDKIKFITPENANQRGATLVIRVLGISDVATIEHELKAASALGQFEIDTRPPNNIRLTAHYGYTKFKDIYRMVTKLENVISSRSAFTVAE